VFDLLVDGQDLSGLPRVERKTRLADLRIQAPASIQYSDHQERRDPAFYKFACQQAPEGIVSKRVDAPYIPRDRDLCLKTKYLNRDAFTVVRRSDPDRGRAVGHTLSCCCLSITTTYDDAGPVGLRRPGRCGDRRRRVGTALAAVTVPGSRLGVPCDKKAVLIIQLIG
jgi:ATP-dependent DNA ligase